MERIFIPSFSFSTDSYFLIFEQFFPLPPLLNYPIKSSFIEMFDETQKLDTINSIETIIPIKSRADG